MTAGMACAPLVGKFHHGIGVGTTAEFLVTLVPQGSDGSDLGLSQVYVSVNFGVARTCNPHLDRIRVDKGVFELVVHKPGGRKGDIA
jgi:hypothetical protein